MDKKNAARCPAKATEPLSRIDFRIMVCLTENRNANFTSARTFSRIASAPGHGDWQHEPRAVPKIELIGGPHAGLRVPAGSHDGGRLFVAVGRGSIQWAVYRIRPDDPSMADFVRFRDADSPAMTTGTAND
jgi:hypothetical protein